jgi:uncharacterized damage-inducible protein DinB
VDHLRTILGHHIWATMSLLDRCLQLSPEQLELSTPGTYGTIHATVVHLVRADHRYLRGITGEERRPWPEDLPPVAVLRGDMEGQARVWRDVLDHVDELDAVMPALPANEDHGAFPEIQHAVGLFLTLAVHHGQDHRTHVCSILGAHGLEVPELNGWEYFLALEIASGRPASTGAP